MKEALRIAGYAGTVLLLFGLLALGVSGVFDLWSAVHIAGGGILLAISLAANLSGVRRSVALRGNRERTRAVAGALVFAALLIALQLLAARYPKSWDATEAKIHTLGDKSLAVLDGLSQTVELVGFFPAGDARRGALEEILARYRARSRQVSFRLVDAETQPQLADQLGVTRQGVLAARCGRETAQADADAPGGLDEGAVTSLILKVTRPGSKRVYVLTGHGEPEATDLETPRGFGALALALQEDNAELRPLLLATEAVVPADAAALVVVGAEKPLIPHEVDALRAYLARGGRVLAMGNPGADPGLQALLADYRLALDDDMVVDQEEIPFLGARLGLDPIVEEFPPHPITRGFRQRILLSQARSITIGVDGGLPGVVALPLARTRPSSWGEAGWREMLATGRVARGADDRAGPLVVAATATAPIASSASAEAGEPPREARLVVVGDSDWAVNANLGSFFNRELLVNSVRWLMGSEDLIVGPPKTLRASRLDMTVVDQRNLFRFGVLLLPEVLLIGGLVAWRRRKAL